MARLQSIKRLLKRHSLHVNVAINVLLLLLCSASYVALFVLYFTQGMSIKAFVNVSHETFTLPPTAVVPLVGIILTSATSAFLTRSVEYNLWGAILCDRSTTHSGRSLTPRDASQRAQWSTSPIARLIYCFNGQSWALRFGGLFLLSTAILFYSAVLNLVMMCESCATILYPLKLLSWPSRQRSWRQIHCLTVSRLHSEIGSTSHELTLEWHSLDGSCFSCFDEQHQRACCGCLPYA
jgi:hypothetical protein